MVQITAFATLIKAMTLLSLVQSPELTAAAPGIFRGWAQVKDTKPPNWPLDPAWPKVITCNKVQVRLSTYQNDIKNAEFQGRYSHNVPRWSLTHTVLDGRKTMTVTIFFTSENNRLIYSPKTSWLPSDGSGISAGTGFVSCGKRF